MMCSLTLWPQKDSKLSFHRDNSNQWPQLLYVLRKVHAIIFFFEKTDNFWAQYTILSDLHTNKKAMTVTQCGKRSGSAIADAPALSSQLCDSDVSPESLSSHLRKPFGFLSFLWNSLISQRLAWLFFSQKRFLACCENPLWCWRKICQDSPLEKVNWSIKSEMSLS